MKFKHVVLLLAILAVCAIVDSVAVRGGTMLLGMAALATDRITETKERGLKAYPVLASTTIYEGALVAIDSNDYAG